MADGIFTLIRHESGGVPCLGVVGEIDFAALQLFATTVCDLIEDGTDRVRLDLTTVTHFGASGLAVLSALGEVAADKDVTLLIHTSPIVRQVLGAAGLTPDT